MAFTAIALLVAAPMFLFESSDAAQNNYKIMVYTGDPDKEPSILYDDPITNTTAALYNGLRTITLNDRSVSVDIYQNHLGDNLSSYDLLIILLPTEQISDDDTLRLNAYAKSGGYVVFIGGNGGSYSDSNSYLTNIGYRVNLNFMINNDVLGAPFALNNLSTLINDPSGKIVSSLSPFNASSVISSNSVEQLATGELDSTSTLPWAIKIENDSKTGVVFGDFGWIANNGTIITTDAKNLFENILSASVYSKQGSSGTYSPVFYHKNDGTFFDLEVITEYKEGESASLPTDIRRTDYGFTGWYTNEQCTGTPKTSISATDTGDINLWAGWTSDYVAVLALSNMDVIQYATLDNAIAKFNSMTDSELTLVSDITVSHESVLSSSGTIILNNHIIDANGSCRIFRITNTANITIKNGTSETVNHYYWKLGYTYKFEDTYQPYHLGYCPYGLLANGKNMSTSDPFAAAIYNEGHLEIMNVGFIGNTSSTGGAIYSSMGSDLIVEYSYFDYNTVTSGSYSAEYNGCGGAIAVRSAVMLSLTNSKFLHSSSSLYGGAVFLMGDNTLALIDCDFDNNSSQYGGGIATTSSDTSISIYSGNFTNNRATSMGGFLVSYGTVTIEDGLFQSNTVSETSDPSYGGSLYLKSECYIHGGTFSENSAIQGGAIFSEDELTIDGTVYIHTNSANNGGGIYSYGMVILNEGIISLNTAEESGAGLYVNAGNLLINGGNIVGNTANIWGGGFFCFRSTANLSGGYISANKANMGSAFAIDQGNGLISAGTIEDNQFTQNGDKWSIYSRNNSKISIYGTASVNDGIHIESGSVYLSGAPTIGYTLIPAISPLMISSEGSMLYASSEEGSIPFTGSITFSYDESLLIDGVVLVSSVSSATTGTFRVFSEDPRFFLSYDSEEKTLRYTLYAAKIDSNYYPTLDDAISNETAGSVIELLKNAVITVGYVSSLSTANYLSIDGKGFTITDGVNLTLFKIDNSGYLKLKDVIISGTDMGSNMIDIYENGTVDLEHISITGCSCGSVVYMNGGNISLTVKSVNISDNIVTPTGAALFITDSSTVEISGECYITNNRDPTNTEHDIILSGSDQLILAGNLSGSIGVDFNNGLGLQFGLAAGDFTGAEVIYNTVSQHIIGSTKDSKLFWGGRPYDITYHLYGSVLDYGTYIYGTAFILPTTYLRKGFQFSKWKDGSGNDVTEIMIGESGPKDYYAQWTQSEIFISSSGSDTDGEGTLEKPYLTLDKAYSVAADGNTISIMTDIVIHNTVEFNRSISIILSSENGTHSYVRGSAMTNSLIDIQNGTITTYDIRFDGNGTVNDRIVDHALIFVQQTGTLVLNNTEIFNNEIYRLMAPSSQTGGAILLTDSAHLIINTGTYIHDNIAFSGSAIYSMGHSYIDMTGGEISNNYCYSGADGGAILIPINNRIMMTGKIVIKNNYNYISDTDMVSSNLYLSYNAYVSLDSDFDESSEIHIITYEAASDTDVLIVKEVTPELVQCFHSDVAPRNILFCDGTENEFGLYHHYPCVPNSLFLTTEIIHVHEFSPSFTWGDNYLSATITLTCQHEVCKKVITDDANVTHEQIAVPDCVDDGAILHTAKYVYSEQIYAENQTEILEALGHNSYHGYCTREGCGIELFDADYILRIDGHYKYVTFNEALADITPGHSLSLIKNVGLSERIEINKNIILTSYDETCTITREFSDFELFIITNNSTVNITDVIFDGNGKIFTVDSSCGFLNISEGSTVNIYDGVVFKNSKTTAGTNHGAVFVNGGVLHLYSGEFTDNYSLNSGAAIYATDNGKIYIEGNVIIQNNYKYSNIDTEDTVISNISYSTPEELIFNCADFKGKLSVDFNNIQIGQFAVFAGGSGYTSIMNDTDKFFHAALDNGYLVWVVDYNVDLYLGPESEYPTPYYTFITTYMSTYGYLPDAEKEGHSFVGWFTATDGGIQVYPGTVVTLKSSHHLYAHWTVNSYILTVDRDNGEPVLKTSVEFGAPVSVSEPVRIGHTFAGWSQTIPETMPASDISVKALWSVNTYTLTFDSNGGSAVLPISQKYGTAITAPAEPTLKGHTFEKWDQPLPATMPAENRSYTAVWAINSYTIIFDSNGGEEIGNMTVKYNATIYLPDPPTRKGYTFNNWEGVIYSQMPDHDLYLKARWNVNYYLMTFDTDGGNTIPSKWQACDSSIEIPADPIKDGYVFYGWDRTIPATMPAEDCVITALWIPRTDTPYTVQHMVQYSDGTYYLDSIDTCSGTTDTWATVTLKNYEHHITGAYEQTTIGAKGNTVVKVYYDLVRSTVSFNTLGGSKVDDQHILYGAKALSPAEPTKKGFTFDCWTRNGLEFNFNTPVYSDIELIASWIGCDVTVNVNQNGMPVRAEVSILNGSGTVVSGMTNDDGTITFNDISYGTFNIKAKSTDGKYYTTVGAVLSNTIYDTEIDLPEDKVNTDIDSNISSNVSVTNIDSAISDSERQRILSDSSIESMTVTMKISEVDTFSIMGMLKGKGSIVEAYDIGVYKLTRFTDSSTFTDTVSSTEDFQFLIFEITDKMIAAMEKGGFGYDNIIIYHSHTDQDGKTSTNALKKQPNYESLLKESVGCFCIINIDGQQLIAMKTKEYSVFSFGLTEENQIVTGTDPTLVYIIIGIFVCTPLVLIAAYLCLRKMRRPKAQ